MKRLAVLIVFIVVLCLLATESKALFGGGSSGELNVTVMEKASSMLLPKLVVRLHGPIGGVAKLREYLTSDDGCVHFTQLPAGKYEITVAGGRKEKNTCPLLKLKQARVTVQSDQCSRALVVLDFIPSYEKCVPHGIDDSTCKECASNKNPEEGERPEPEKY